MTLLHEFLQVGTEYVQVLLGNSYLMSSVPVSSTLAVNSSLTRLL